MSAVERLVSKDDLVIADAMNYIKGFRYQLYCVARAISTPHCVVGLSRSLVDGLKRSVIYRCVIVKVHCGTPINLARQWNSERQQGAYPEDVYVHLYLHIMVSLY
jgi:protein KTI12